MAISDWISDRVFQFVHQHNLVYNTCWEDPRLDRAALQLDGNATVAMITSAGCNALDYVLAGARTIHAIDLNPRQNALLELKIAGIRRLQFDDFFAMFGHGSLDRAGRVYGRALRPQLSPWAQAYWDRWIEFFEPGNRRPFYFRGASGAFALLLNSYLRRIARLRPWIDAILSAKSLDEQRAVYENHLAPRIWTRPLRFAINRDSLLSLVGVPRDQRRQIDRQYAGGVPQFVQDCLEAVFARLPLADNYFWRVYLTGRYSRDCCPEYLKPDNFERLRAGLVDRIVPHTASMQGFLEGHDEPLSHFVLLDHMDWLSGRRLPLLQAEWQAIVRRAAPGARIIWRSGGLRTDFVDELRLTVGGRSRALGELLRYHRELAAQLHPRCRVHTYGSFHIADLAI